MGHAFTVFHPYAHDEPSAIDVKGASMDAGVQYHSLDGIGYESLDQYAYSKFEAELKTALSSTEGCAVICTPHDGDPFWHAPSWGRAGLRGTGKEARQL